MAQRTLYLQLPRPSSPSRTALRTSALIVGTLLWLSLYATLAYRLLMVRFALTDRLNLGLITACILLGVIVVLGWRSTPGSWISYLFPWMRRSQWRALNLEQMQALTPSEFEEYVARHIFERQGYRIFNVRDTKDGGIDVLITGADGQQAVVQCKLYSGRTVGEPIVRDLYGTMIHAGATHAYLVTNSTISADARRWAFGKPITLIDGRRLVEMAQA